MSDQKYLGQNLIFIISLPRSGSTLLQRVLAGHPEIGASSEPWIMLHQAYSRSSEGIETDYGADWAALGVNEFVEHYTDGDEVYDDAIRAYARVLYENAMARSGTSIFIDKTPRYILILDHLIRWFPKAHFVFLLRNPLAVLASIITTQISHDLSTLERFASELIDGPPAMLRAIRMLGDRATVVRFEEFVASPQHELEQICTRLGVSADPDMLDYGKRSDMPGFMQDRTGLANFSRPTDTGADRWLKLLDDPQATEFARGYLGELESETLAALGYSHADMQQAVSKAVSRFRGRGVILSWNVAVLSPRDQKGADQFEVLRYRGIRDHGPLKGRLLACLIFARGMANIFKFVVGNGWRGRPGRMPIVPEKQAK